LGRLEGSVRLLLWCFYQFPYQEFLPLKTQVNRRIKPYPDCYLVQGTGKGAVFRLYLEQPPLKRDHIIPADHPPVVITQDFP
jgi:hypothetical protein